MYLKIFTFVAILFLFAGHACAGLIGADWSDPDPSACSSIDAGSMPSEAPSPNPTGWLDGGSESLAAVVTGGAGSNVFSLAIPVHPLFLPASCFFTRLAFDNDALPTSPVLEGLLKPA